MTDKELTNGECLICGLPGTVGLHCSDPDCQGMVERLEEKSKEQKESDRYDEDLMADDSIVSLDTLAEDEQKDDEEVDQL